MKKIIGIALALALVMGVAAFAEATDPVPATPAVTEEGVAAEEATTEEAPAASGEMEKVEDEQKALQDALDAYRKAKQDKAVSDLEEELNEYVAAGSMTQEQADLILKNVKERMAAKNGECPNYGYDLRGQRGATPRQGGQRGSKMGGQMNGQRGGQMNGQQIPGGQHQNGQAPQMNGQMPDNQMNGMAQPQM